MISIKLSVKTFSLLVNISFTFTWMEVLLSRSFRNVAHWPSLISMFPLFSSRKFRLHLLEVLSRDIFLLVEVLSNETLAISQFVQKSHWSGNARKFFVLNYPHNQTHISFLLQIRFLSKRSQLTIFFQLQSFLFFKTIFAVVWLGLWLIKVAMFHYCLWLFSCVATHCSA